MTLLKCSMLLILGSCSALIPQIGSADFSQQGPKLVGTGAVINGPGLTAQQGYAVALSSDGNTAIVGGYGDNAFTGASWVFVRNVGVWTQQGEKLVGTGASGQARQGVSVALSGDGNIAIVGGPGDNDGIGAAWVFVRTGGVWNSHGTRLFGGGAFGNSDQGIAVAMSADGSTAIVGGSGDHNGDGAVWVFTQLGGVWTQQGTKLVGTGAVGSVAQQGSSVALSADGNTAIVGGRGDNAFAGAVWIFTRSGGVWNQQGPKLVGTGAVGNAEQGISAALSGDGSTAISGGYSDNGTSGAAWVFTGSGGVWTQQGAKLIGIGGQEFARQGISVAVSADGNTTVVGGIAGSPAGAAWIFTRAGGLWTQLGSMLVGTGAVGAAAQGRSVAMSGDGTTALVGGIGDNSGAGATWVYTSRADATVYTPLEPCRIMDTRSATPASGVQGPITGGAVKQLPGFMTTGANWSAFGGAALSDCGLSNPPGSSIRAIAIVTSILNPNFDSFLGISDVNVLNTVLSNVALNYTHGQGLSSTYFVPQIASNSIYFAMPSGLSAHVIFDVVGYFSQSDAATLQCTTQSSQPTALGGNGGRGSATSPVCAPSYALVSGSCESDSPNVALWQHEASGGSTTWLCSATNRGALSANLTATANCCRAPGR